MDFYLFASEFVCLFELSISSCDGSLFFGILWLQFWLVDSTTVLFYHIS